MSSTDATEQRSNSAWERIKNLLLWGVMIVILVVVIVTLPFTVPIMKAIRAIEDFIGGR
jgi:t-SNARE complex subunit (syntaxin)